MTSYLTFDVFSIEPIDGLSHPQLTIKTWDREIAEVSHRLATDWHSQRRR